MKNKLLALLLTLMMCCSVLLLASCGGFVPPVSDGEGDDTAYRNVYASYVVYAEDNGIEPDSYEEWLESIK